MNFRSKTVLAILLLSLAAAAVANREIVVEIVNALAEELPFWLSALLYIAIFAAAAVLLVPNSLLMMLAGALYGLSSGLCLNITAFTLGASLSFLASRYLLSDWVRARFYRGRTKDILQNLPLAGWQVVALLRLTPLFPAFTVSYALGATAIRLRDFAWATAVFSLPSAFFLTYTGHTGRQLFTGGDNLVMHLLMVLLLLGLCVAASVYARKKMLAAKENNPHRATQ